MPSVRHTTRQAIARPRSDGSSDTSAGSATYGTWKQANALAASRNMTPAQPAANPGEPPGTANIAANRNGSVTAPSRSSLVRWPVRTASRSLAAPTTGLSSTSHAFGTTRTTPAITAETPRTSVR